MRGEVRCAEDQHQSRRKSLDNLKIEIPEIEMPNTETPNENAPCSKDADNRSGAEQLPEETGSTPAPVEEKCGTAAPGCGEGTMELSSTLPEINAPEPEMSKFEIPNK